jgi:hypothetical protein
MNSVKWLHVQKHERPDERESDAAVCKLCPTTSPQNAEAILTNTSSPEVAAQREALAREFVKEQVEPKVDGAYQEARGSMGQGMPGCQAVGDMVLYI